MKEQRKNTSIRTIINIALFFFIAIIVSVFFVFIKLTENKTEVNSNDIDFITPQNIPQITSKLSKQLDYDNPQITEEVQQEVTILFAGDTMLARSIGDMIITGENPFKYVKDEFIKYDFVILNLECVVSDRGAPFAGKKFTFQAPVRAISTLELSGVDIVSLSNNHTMDYGNNAFLDMIQRLDNSEIRYFGGGRDRKAAFAPLIIQRNGISIALLAFNEPESWVTKAGEDSAGTAWYQEDYLFDSITEAEDTADVTIVVTHWGTEYSREFSGDQQIKAQKMIDAGADLIVGAHPHVIQGFEVYEGKYIYYSLGNFAFDQMPHRGDGSGKGNMLEMSIEGNGNYQTRLIPIQLTNEGLPSLSEF
ncbi:CapA family protein [Candidatus Dojkabacteria bacterium]|nr:CapA family protein [Candidatus Dojkabacteria bacterium]